MASEKILLLDGNSFAYRAFFALPLLTNEHGIHTNAVYGFTMMLQKIMEEEKPTHMLVAFDAGKTTFRHSTFEEYKGGRQKTPPELSEQFPYIRKLIDAYGIKRYELEMYEADDIIGTLSKQADEKGQQVVIVSGDKDLTQLATDKTTVYITRKGITDIEKYTPAHIEEKYGLTPLQIIDMKGLMGDASDNIPGVPGVGEKTAIKLLKEHGSVENLYQALDTVSGVKLKEKLTANEEQAKMSKSLATIEVNAPIEVAIEDLTYSGPNMEDVVDIWKELSFKTLLEKTEYVEEDQETTEIQFTILDEIDASILQDTMALHLEMYDEQYHTSELLGISLFNGEESYFVPGSIAFESPVFCTWLEDATKIKYLADSKATQAVSRKHKVSMHGVEFDLLLAAYIVNPSISSDDVSSIAKEFGYYNVLTNDSVYGKGAKKSTPELDKIAEHASRKAQALWNLKPTLEEKLKENEQYEFI